ncbi:alpha/beta hydrolase [Chitinophaga sp. 22321]|uniref:Alpha/beta hydrolase n=1 Tax=Chitinophaga hostae TaxID=2831022 RepID=A0ABS5J1H0_9BACT|nr:alpha/beta hydrolase [Chitinophaga hostae]MBS0028287.1 alpha/beta hydrolase [Chitinophaga hostae]
MKQKIQFFSEGALLSGHLYSPDNFNANEKYPTILVGGSWTTVKEQMSGLYAEALSKHGFITLAIDLRYFGESEGNPRFWENPTAKIADFKNAINYLHTVNGVDTANIFLAGICASSGYMANVAAQDNRIKAFATIAAWLHDHEALKLYYGGEEGVQSKIRQAREAKQKYAETGVADYVPCVSATDVTAAMYGDFSYYLDPERGAVPQWSADKFAVMSWEDWLNFNPMPVASNIPVPTLMIHSDHAVLPDYTKQFFAGIPHKDKVLHWTTGTQFDFYDNPRQVCESVAAINVFFKNHLG